MSVKLYDDALLLKLRNWTNTVDLQIYDVNESARVFEHNADKNDDKPITLPLVSIQREGMYTINNINKQPLSYDGVTTEASIEKSIQLNAIPITINYRIDIYSRYFEEADELVRNFIFNLVNFPKISVTIPYLNKQIVHDSTIKISNSIEDNSSIPERIIKGQFTRLSISLSIDDAYIWDVRLRDNYELCDIKYVYE